MTLPPLQTFIFPFVGAFDATLAIIGASFSFFFVRSTLMLYDMYMRVAYFMLQVNCFRSRLSLASAIFYLSNVVGLRVGRRHRNMASETMCL